MVAASVVAGPVEQKPAAEKKPKEEWYKIAMKGKPVGYGHLSVTYEEHEGRAIRHVVYKFHLQMPFPGGSAKVMLQMDIRQELDGRLIRITGTTKAEAPGDGGDQERKYVATVAGGLLKGTETGPDGKKEKNLPLPKGGKVYANVDAWLLKQHDIGPGKTAEFQIVAFGPIHLQKNSVKKVERVKHVHDGKEVDALRAVIESRRRVGNGEAISTNVIIMTTDYDMLKMVSDGIVLVRSNKKDALANIPPPQIKDDVQGEIQEKIQEIQELLEKAKELEVPKGPDDDQLEDELEEVVPEPDEPIEDKVGDDDEIEF